MRGEIHMRFCGIFLVLGLLGVAVPEVAMPKGAQKKMDKTTTEKATFAAGCFWGVEAAFRQVKGVVSTQVGYTGGRKGNTSYKAARAAKTGPAGTAQVRLHP